MLWVQNPNVDLLDVGDLDSHAAESWIVSASDGIQLRQPVKDCLPLLSVARGPPVGSTRIIGAYEEDSIKWIALPACIAGKASSATPRYIL